MRFSSFNDVYLYLDGLGLFHMDLGLDRVRAFLDQWGAGNPGYPVIHVVGTNGKGSTGAFLSELAQAHGLKTGLYSSPHLASVRERVLVDGRMLPKTRWVELARRVMDHPSGRNLTYFEFLTALALLAFEEEGVDLAVMEAGLGGRYDAVNALCAELTVFTPIGMDHEAVLGPTLKDIARDKAGAVKPGGAALTGPQPDEAMEELLAAARAAGVSLAQAADLVRGFEDRTAFRLSSAELGLMGEHQRDNAALALAAWLVAARTRGMEPDPGACAQALQKAFVPARMQRISGAPSLIIDGAHNVHALRALSRSLKAAHVEPSGLVFACLRDKNMEGMDVLVRSLTPGRIVVPGLPGCERASAPETLAARLGVRAETAPDLFAALETFRGGAGPVLVCGSLYLAAEFYTRYPAYLRPCAEPWNLRRGADIRRLLSPRPWKPSTPSKG